MALDIAGFSGILSRVKTPLTIAGLALLIFYGVLSKILGLGIFSQLQERSTSDLLTRILSYTFVIAIVCVVLGVAAYLVTYLVPAPKTKRRRAD
jgi:hypothetical protein